VEKEGKKTCEIYRSHKPRKSGSWMEVDSQFPLKQCACGVWKKQLWGGGCQEPFFPRKELNRGGRKKTRGWYRDWNERPRSGGKRLGGGGGSGVVYSP